MAFLDTLNKLLGDPNEKELKRLRPIIKQVRDRGAQQDIRALTLEMLPARTEEMKKRVQERIAAGTLRGSAEHLRVTTRAVLDEMLPEAFAVAIRACELLAESNASMQIGKQTFTWNPSTCRSWAERCCTADASLK